MDTRSAGQYCSVPPYIFLSMCSKFSYATWRKTAQVVHRRTHQAEGAELAVFWGATTATDLAIVRNRSQIKPLDLQALFQQQRQSVHLVKWSC